MSGVLPTCAKPYYLFNLLNKNSNIPKYVISFLLVMGTEISLYHHPLDINH